MNNEDIRKELFKLQDIKYKDFSAKLTPGEDNIIGVRLPAVRKLAKEIANKNYQEFLENPYTLYHEERLLYGLVISYLNADVDTVLNYLDGWLKCVNNWAVCDSVIMNIKIFKKPENKEKAFSYLTAKLNDKNPFVIRAVIVALFCYLNGEEYYKKTAEIYQSIKNDHFYVKMALSWGMCEILIKHYGLGIEIIKNRSLDVWVHNKAIQKSLESFRIDEIKKEELKKLKIYINRKENVNEK